MTDILLYILVLVSIIIGFYLSRALSKHIYGKDYNKQKISPISNQLKIFSKTQRMIIIGIPICVALVCAILFRLISNNKISDFIFFGSISVIVNLILIFFLILMYKEKFIKPLGGYSIAITYIFTLLVPFTIYYILLSLILSRFKMPFVY